jgi:starvation-inducible DNA-binding protein
VKDIAGALTALLADVFALYITTKNFHWHMSGPHFRDYYLLLDEHGDQLFGITDDIAAGQAPYLSSHNSLSMSFAVT